MMLKGFRGINCHLNGILMFSCAIFIFESMADNTAARNNRYNFTEVCA